jgi:hypothetical protein
MKKPLNKFALALWVLAVLVILGEFASFASMREGLHDLPKQGGENFFVAGAFWTMFRAGVLSGVQMATYGVLIELVDQIRWNALHRSK